MYKIMACLVLFLAPGIVNATGIDCPNAVVDMVILNDNGSVILHISGPQCAVDNPNVCLNTDSTKQTQVNRMYSLALAYHMANKPLARISFDDSQIVPNCGYPLVTEIR